MTQKAAQIAVDLHHSAKFGLVSFHAPFLICVQPRWFSGGLQLNDAAKPTLFVCGI